MRSDNRLVLPDIGGIAWYRLIGGEVESVVSFAVCSRSALGHIEQRTWVRCSAAVVAVCVSKSKNPGLQVHAHPIPYTEIEQRYNIEFKSDSCPDVVDFYDVDYNVDALWNLPVDVERGIYFDLIFLNLHYELESLDRALVTDLDAEAMTFRYSTMELFFGVSSPVPWFGSYPMQVRRSLYALIKH